MRSKEEVYRKVQELEKMKEEEKFKEDSPKIEYEILALKWILEMKGGN